LGAVIRLQTLKYIDMANNFGLHGLHMKIEGENMDIYTLLADFAIGYEISDLNQCRLYDASDTSVDNLAHCDYFAH